jgi:uncharacterized repeat protein (TIGR02543 family)
MIRRYSFNVIFLSALFFYTAFITCANNEVSSGAADIELWLIWRSNDRDASNSEVATLHVAITSDSPLLKDSVVTTIYWQTKSGSIRDIPIGIPITVSIDACNQFNEVLFRGIDSIPLTSSVTQFSVVLFKQPPLAPSNLEFSVLSGTKLKLTWHDNTTVEDNFRIERGLNTDSYGTISTTQKNDTSFLDTTILYSGTYHYRISAINEAGHSAFSTGQVSVIIPSNKPSPVPTPSPAPAPTPEPAPHINRLPILNSINSVIPKDCTVGKTITFTIPASDPDSDKLIFSLSDNLLIVGASLDSLTGKFVWTPTEPANFIGVICVSDGHTSNCQDVKFVARASCTISSKPIINPDITVSSTRDSITLSVLSGTLEPGGSWVWHVNSSVYTPSLKGNTIRVAPTVTTSYFCRGEGPCGVGEYDTVTVSVKDFSCCALFFDGNGNNVENLPQPIDRLRNSEVTLPMQTPTRPGYIFSCWNTYASGNGKDYHPGSVCSITNDNVTLYAQWIF